jgi:hypothetical protein
MLRIFIFLGSTGAQQRKAIRFFPKDLQKYLSPLRALEARHGQTLHVAPRSAKEQCYAAVQDHYTIKITNFQLQHTTHVESLCLAAHHKENIVEKDTKCMNIANLNLSLFFLTNNGPLSQIGYTHS